MKIGIEVSEGRPWPRPREDGSQALVAIPIFPFSFSLFYYFYVTVFCTISWWQLLFFPLFLEDNL